MYYCINAANWADKLGVKGTFVRACRTFIWGSLDTTIETET